MPGVDRDLEAIALSEKLSIARAQLFDDGFQACPEGVLIDP